MSANKLLAADAVAFCAKRGRWSQALSAASTGILAARGKFRDYGVVVFVKAGGGKSLGVCQPSAILIFMFSV